MKNIIITALATVLSINAMSQSTANQNATTEAQELLNFIYAQSGNGTLTGQHSYPLYSDIYMERVENFTGSHPVVFGQDFGYSKHNSLDGVNFRQRTIDNAIKWHQKGAIITLMWHAVPPNCKENYTIWRGEHGIQSKLTDKEWKDLFTEGTEINQNWKSQVDVIAFYLKQLQDENIPVIWRPYHEMNGDWFWWGYNEENYKKLYIMLWNRLTEYHKINNLLWVFNANELNSQNVKPYDGFYPGDKYVDILATDIYNSDYKGDDYEQLLRLGNGKPIAWGEVGKLPTPEIIKQQPKWVWFMCWSEFLETANDWNRRTDIYNAQNTITLEELNDKKINKMNNDVIIQQMKDAHADILNFWTDNMIDSVNGGFYGQMNFDGKIVPDAQKGAILNGRILWTYSKAANTFGNETYRKMATRAFEYIQKYFYDKKNGGFYWSLNADGSPADTKKQAYAESFVIYGLSEYYILTKDQRAIDLAYETYRLMEKHFRDKKFGGYTEACAANWTLTDDLRLSPKELNLPKTMNTHLHVLEAFTNLYRAKPSPELRESIVHCLNIFKDKIIDPETGHFILYFGMDWSVNKNLHIDSYGHDIEGGWLIYEAAEVIDDKELMETLKPICRRLVDVTLAEGFDGESISYEIVNGKLDSDRHWWPQAETLVGLADTYRLTGEQIYLELLYKVWHYIDTRVIDHQHGEWFGRINKDGKAVYNDMKAGFWKCPYHNSRAMIEVISRLK